MENRTWTLEPADRVERSTFQTEEGWGGRPQGGIAPSRKTPNIFIFLKATAEQEFGYADGWHTDGCLHYTGEGQVGDQTMPGVNNSLLNHKREPRQEVRVFEGSGGPVAYVGRFEVDDNQPYYRTDAPDRKKNLRQVIVFRLRPLEVDSARIPARAIDAPVVKMAPLENHQSDGYLQIPNIERREVVKREAALVAKYKEYLTDKADEVSSHHYKPAPEPRYLRNDLFNETRKHLIEAKGQVTREAIRMLIGQVTDYSRFEADPDIETAALLPERPRPDLEALLKTAGIVAVWAEGDGFADNARGKFS